MSCSKRMKSKISYKKMSAKELSIKTIYDGIYRDNGTIIIKKSKNAYIIKADDWNRHIKPKLVFKISPYNIFVISRHAGPYEIICVNSRLYITDRHGRRRKFKGKLKFHDVEMMSEHVKNSFRTLYPLRLLLKAVSVMPLIKYDDKIYSGVTGKRIKAPLETAFRIVVAESKLKEIRSAM